MRATIVTFAWLGVLSSALAAAPARATQAEEARDTAPGTQIAWQSDLAAARADAAAAHKPLLLLFRCER